MFLVPSTNPSSWAVIGIGTYWAFLLRFLSGDPGRGTWTAGAFAVVSATVAAGARADAAAYLVVSTVAVLIVSSSLQDLRRPKMLLPLCVVAAGVAVYFSVGQSRAIGGFGNVPGFVPQRTGASLLLNNLYSYPSLLGGVFGQAWGLGWLDTAVPPGAALLSASAAFALLVLSASSYWRRKAVAVGLLAILLVAVPLYVLQGGGNVVGENVQPRYLLPLVIVGLGLALLSQDGAPPWPLGRTRVVVLVLAVATANALSLQSELRRYVTGTDVGGLRLDRGVEWWWDSSFNPMVLWVAGSLAGLAFFRRWAGPPICAPRPTHDSIVRGRPAA